MRIPLLSLSAGFMAWLTMVAIMLIDDSAGPRTLSVKICMAVAFASVAVAVAYGIGQLWKMGRAR